MVGFVLTAEARPRRGPITRVSAGGSHLLFRLYSWIDSRRFGTGNDPLDEVDLSRRLERAPVATLDNETLGEIGRWDLDVLLKLGSRLVPDAVLGAARHGVWAYRFGAVDSDRAGPPLFWEIHDGAPVSESALLRIADRPGADQLLYASTSATDPISLHRSRTRIYWKSAEFVVRKLRDVHRDGELSGLRRG